MTNLITLTIPNDDHIALRAFGKALEEMALAHGAEPRKTTAGELSYKLNIDTTDATAALERLRTTAEEFQPEVDTTAQQVESLTVPGATHVMTEQTLVGEPVPVGDGNFSQGYIATVEEIADPVDSTGTPWDERIHSTSKALNADGTWRLRRKPADKTPEEWTAYVKWVEEDVHLVMSLQGETDEDDDKYSSDGLIVSVASASPDVEPYDVPQEKFTAVTGFADEPTVTPPGDDFHADAVVVTEQTVVGIPPLPVPPPVVVAPPVPEITTWDFPRLMTFLTERHGKIDVATVNTLLAQDGMSSVQELNAHPDKIGPFVARVKAHLGE